MLRDNNDSLLVNDMTMKYDKALIKGEKLSLHNSLGTDKVVSKSKNHHVVIH